MGTGQVGFSEFTSSSWLHKFVSTILVLLLTHHLPLESDEFQVSKGAYVLAASRRWEAHRRPGSIAKEEAQPLLIVTYCHLQ